MVLNPKVPEWFFHFLYLPLFYLQIIDSDILKEVSIDI